MSPAARELVSVHLLQPLRGLYRLTRPSLRPAALETGEGLRFRAGAATWSLDQRREWMLARLREMATARARGRSSSRPSAGLRRRAAGRPAAGRDRRIDG